MKAHPLSLVLFLLAAALIHAAPLQRGSTLEQTLESLGNPVGTIELREKTLLLYPQGEVTLKNGVVTDFDLMTEAEFAADQAQLQQEREKWLQQQERRAIERRQEGEAIKADKLQSPAFAALPPKERVAYWRNFQIQYPNVDVSEPLKDALERYETELAALRSQQHVAALEARVAAAEREATVARVEAERLRQEAEQRQNTNYGLRYYSDPVVHPRYYYRPPTITIYTDGNGNQNSHYHNKRKHRPEWRLPAPQTESTAERVSRILDQTHSKRRAESD